MKIQAVCGKCGKTFAAEEGVRTDICPHCMSFVEVADPRLNRGKNPGDAKSVGNENIRGEVFAEHFCPQEKRVPPEGIKERGEAEAYEALLMRAQKYCDRKEWRKAGDCYEKCLDCRKDWRADFGIVFTQTRGFTDFSQFAFSEGESAKALTSHVRAAFSKMNEEKRKQYAARYLPLLKKCRAELCEGRAALDTAVPRAVEELRRLNEESGEEKGEVRRSKRKLVVSIGLFSGFFLLAVIGSVICFIVQEYVFAAVTVFLSVFFAAGLFVSAGSCQKLKRWGKIDETLRFSYMSTIRDKKLLGEVSERASEQIAAIDLISGYLKH